MVSDICWSIILPLAIAVACSLAAHKPTNYSEAEKVFPLRTESFHRNFFLNANFGLFFGVVQKFSNSNGFFVAMLTLLMMGTAWFISNLIKDIPHDAYSKEVVKKRVFYMWFGLFLLIVLSAISPRLVKTLQAYF